MHYIMISAINPFQHFFGT